MTSETKSKWKPCKCGHELADHAQPGQGWSRLPCEHSGCECQDFTIEENQAERVEVPELPSDLPLPASIGISIYDGAWEEWNLLNGERLVWANGLSKVDAAFLADLINAVYLPGGLRDRLVKAEARVRELEDAGWNDLEEQLKSGGKSPVVPT